MKINGRRKPDLETFMEPDDGDPRWPRLLSEHIRRRMRFHIPLPPGDPDDLQTFCIVRSGTPDGNIEEVIYLSTTADVERFRKLPPRCNYESVLRLNPAWTVSQMLDYLEAQARA